jgi:hypothetical protein
MNVSNSLKDKDKDKDKKDSAKEETLMTKEKFKVEIPPNPYVSAKEEVLLS